MRRYTRLSNDVSRKVENQAAAAAINCLAYNFSQIHSTLRVTPAMEPWLGQSRLQHRGNHRITRGQMSTPRTTLWILLGVVGTLLAIVAVIAGIAVYFRTTG
jgi:hypothetical protein